MIQNQRSYIDFAVALDAAQAHGHAILTLRPGGTVTVQPLTAVPTEDQLREAMGGKYCRSSRVHSLVWYALVDNEHSVDTIPINITAIRALKRPPSEYPMRGNVILLIGVKPEPYTLSPDGAEVRHNWSLATL